MVRPHVQPRRRPRRRAPRWPARPDCCAARACCRAAGGAPDDRAPGASTSARPACGPPSSTATSRSGPSRGGRSRRRRRSRGSSSSTPPSSSAIVLDAVAEATAGADPVTAVGITNQRASTIVWDRATGEPIAPALGWQDLRTVGECLVARAEHDLALAPNQSATKLAWLLANTPGSADRDLCFGTVDTWLAWSLSGGAVHVTDPSNAGDHRVHGARRSIVERRVLDVLGLDAALLPAIVDTSGVVGEATALPGAPPIAALVGDQQASLVGQGCVTPGRAKITFGTGGMLDVCTGAGRPDVGPARRARHLPDRGVVPWRRRDVGRRGDHARRRHERRVAARGPRAHRHERREPRRGGVASRRPTASCSCPRCSASARRSGTTARAARCSASPGARRVPTSCGPCWRASPIAAPTWSPRPRPTPGTTIERLRVDGGMSTEPDVHPGAGRRPPDARWRCHRSSRRRRSAPPSWPAWRPACGATWPTPTGRGRRRGSTSRPARLDRATWARAVERAAGWIPELSALDV